MNFETLQSSYELYQNGHDYRDIARHLGKSLGYASNLLTYFKHGSLADVADILVYKHYKTYALDEYIDIAEQMISNKIRISHGVLQFRIPFNRLAALTKLRKDKDKRLEFEDLEILSWVGTAVTEHKPDRSSNIKATPHSTVLDKDDLPHDKQNLVTDKPRKFGRAVATPRSYHGKKAMRNKAEVEAKKQQSRINQNLAEGEEQLRQDSGSDELVSVGRSVSKEQVDVVSLQTTDEPLSASGNVDEEQVDVTTQQTTDEPLSVSGNVGEKQVDVTTQQTTDEPLSASGNVDEEQVDVTTQQTIDEPLSASGNVDEEQVDVTTQQTTDEPLSVSGNVGEKQDDVDNQDCKPLSQISKKAANKPSMFHGHPASKFLDDEGNYIGGSSGRPPFIDVYSEGFDKLPLEVQLASYRRFRELSKLRINFLKKVHALAKN